MKKLLFFFFLTLVFASCNKPASQKVYNKWKGKWQLLKTESASGDVYNYEENNVEAITEFFEDGTVGSYLNGEYLGVGGYVYPQTGIHLKIKSFVGDVTYLTDKGFFGNKKVVTWTNVETKEILYLTKVK